MATIELSDALAFERTLRRLAHQILENNDPETLILAGILRRGVPLAERLSEMMNEFGGVRPQVETLDITLYRDDLSEDDDQPRLNETKIDFSVSGKTVIMVDDVLYTGRTARAAGFAGVSGAHDTCAGCADDRAAQRMYLIYAAGGGTRTSDGS